MSRSESEILEACFADVETLPQRSVAFLVAAHAFMHAWCRLCGAILPYVNWLEMSDMHSENMYVCVCVCMCV